MNRRAFFTRLTGGLAALLAPLERLESEQPEEDRPRKKDRWWLVEMESTTGIRSDLPEAVQVVLVDADSREIDRVTKRIRQLEARDVRTGNP